MDRGRVGEDRGSKETDGCPLTHGAIGIRKGVADWGGVGGIESGGAMVATG
jgi:hypothetical protein